ncbi:MAG: patatin-like phospholipase family protein [Myxococcales bacterium]|nr:patatin-like phospholipase family protein [Myxococcales bacterium]
MPALIDRLRGKRVGVALSSAFFGFYGHTGFMKALAARGLRPTALAGTSAGAIVAAFAARDGGLDRLEGTLAGLRRRDFWDPGLPRGTGLLKGERFGALLARHLPAERFEDLDTPLVVVSTDLVHRRRRVDTTGPLAPSVLASCALPLMFRAVELDGRPHVDGGLLDKVPVRALLERHPLDVLLVHLLPSASLTGPFPRDPWRFVNAALDLVRDDAWRLQAAWAETQGVEVIGVETHLPRLGPFRLGKGLAVVAEAEAKVGAVLDAP